MKHSTIGFLGAGNMAGSLITGLLRQGHSPERLIAADIDSEKLAQLASRTGIRTGDNDAVASQAEAIVLAVKPQVMQSVCSDLQVGSQRPLFVSIAAGITLAQLRGWLGPDVSIVRCMPNTPALIGKSASGLFGNSLVSANQHRLAEELLASVGLCVWVRDESALDLITAVSGSGPAYFFLFMEAMQDAAISLGMDREMARKLVLQTASGAAELAQHQDIDVAELRRRVTSPGGTTERAIETFEAGDLHKLVNEAISAARDRSIELAKESGAE